MKRALWLGGVLVALLTIAVAYVLNPAVQRGFVLDLIPRPPGAEVSIEHFSVTPRHVLVTGARLAYPRATVEVPRFEASYDLWALLFDDTVRMSRLRAEGVVIALHRLPADSTEIPQGERDELTELNLPLHVDDAVISGELTTKSPDGRSTMRYGFRIAADGVAPGKTGGADVRATIVEELPDVVHDSGVANGRLSVRQTAEGTLDLVTFEATLEPGTPDPNFDRRLRLEAILDASTKPEHYALRLTPFAGDTSAILRIDSRLTPRAQHTDGFWSVDVESEEILPYLGRRYCPPFRATGRGTFTHDPPDSQLARLTGHLEVTTEKFDGLIERWYGVGADGDMLLDLPGLKLGLKEVSFEMLTDRNSSFAHGTLSAREWVPLNLKTMRPLFDESSIDQVDVHVTGFPIAWIGRYVPGLDIRSGDVWGHLRATATLADTIVQYVDPFQIRNLDLYWHEQAVGKNLTVDIKPRFEVIPEGLLIDLEELKATTREGDSLRAWFRIRDLDIETADIRIAAGLDVTIASLVDLAGRVGHFSASLETDLDLQSNTYDVDNLWFQMRDYGGPEWFSARNLQPFKLVSDPFRIDASTDDDAIFRARFSPRHRDTLLVNPLGLDLSGITLGGEVVIGSRLGELAFWTEAPLTVGPLDASFDKTMLFTNSGIRFHGDITFGPNDIRVSDMRATLETPNDTLVHADGVAIIDLEDQLIDSAADFALDVRLAPLVDQPIGEGGPRYSSGRLITKVHTEVSDSLEVDASIRIFDWHIRPEPASARAVRRDTLPELDLDIIARGTVAEGGRLELPIAIRGRDDESDMYLRGTWGPLHQRSRNFTMNSSKLVLSDVLDLVRQFLPTDGAYSPVTATADDSLTAFARLRGHRDERPFWGGRVPTDLDVSIDTVRIGEYDLEGLGAHVRADSALLRLDAVRASMLGASFGATMETTFDPIRALPYDLDASFDIVEIEIAQMFLRADPDVPPMLEGQFRIAQQARGRGANILDVVDRTVAGVRLESGGGLCRLLDPGKAKSLSFWAGIGGIFSKEFGAVSRLVRNLPEFPYDTMEVAIVRTAPDTVHLRSLTLQTPNSLITGFGIVHLQDDRPAGESPMELQIQLATRGDLAILFDGMKLLQKDADANGFRPLKTRLTVRGTLDEPDASELYDRIDQGIKNARGLFGWALRRVQGKIKKEEKKRLEQEEKARQEAASFAR